MTEFELIKRYFQNSRHHRADVVLGIGDDAALLQPPTNQLLAVTTDTLIEGVHFFPDVSPKTLGHKSLAVSLSDLAAMGAEPAWVLLSLTLPKVDETWLAAFCEGFFSLGNTYNVQLVGGNTTRGPLSISTQLTGFVPPEQALRRDTAQPGDLIYVTGYLGDAAAALACLQKKLILSTDELQAVKSRLEMPTPRVALGLALRNIATAAIDISDGLIADLKHILERSHVGAVLQTASLPLSETLANLPRDIAIKFALGGGDDYELCFTVHPEKMNILEKALAKFEVQYQKIGVITKETGLQLEGQDVTYEGYDHFFKF